jgi:Flp pilus assembly CpaF family ATPase
VNAFGALGGLQPLLDDESIETININGCDRVFVQYRDGSRARVGPVADSDEDLVAMLQALAAGRPGAGGQEGNGRARHERRFDHGSPQLQLSLPGGARLHALMDVTDRPSVSIRRHLTSDISVADLVHAGALSDGLGQLLPAMVRARRNIVISGGPATGKTTLLRALAGAIPPDERILTVEDVYELDLPVADHPDLVAQQVREPNLEGAGGFGMAQLLRASLRMTPDRVIVGEVRGPEVVQMAKAMSIGIDGSMATVHASSSAQALARLVAYAMEPGAGYSHPAATALIGGAVHVVVHLAFGPDGRRVVASVREVLGDPGGGGEGGFGVIATNEIYAPGPAGRAVPATLPRCLDQLEQAGFDPGWIEHDRRAARA